MALHWNLEAWAFGVEDELQKQQAPEQSCAMVWQIQAHVLWSLGMMAAKNLKCMHQFKSPCHLPSSARTSLRLSEHRYSHSVPFGVTADKVKAPPAALLAQQSQASLASRSLVGSDPFLDGPSSSSPLDPRPARIRALSGGKSSQMPLPRLPRPVAARGSPLKTTMRPESVGEPVSSIDVVSLHWQFFDIHAAPFDASAILFSCRCLAQRGLACLPAHWD